MPNTIITCQHFLKAIEEELYGWRWECPKGGVKCMYRHMLPQGYVLTSKKDREAQRKQQEEEALNTETIEEKIEKERAALKYDDLTPVTKESFYAWKERRAKEKQDKLEEDVRKTMEDKAAKKAAAKGKNSIMNGRALFQYNPDLFKEEAIESTEANIKGPEEEKVDESLFANEQVDEDEEVDFD